MYTNCNVEKKPKKRKLWIDDDNYREIPVKNKERPARGYRDEPEPQPDMVLRNERYREW